MVRPNQLKYQKVRHDLEQLVSSLSEGDRLPSERELAVQYDCTALTVRKAIAPLAHMGLIVRRRGSGTFVTQHGASSAANSAASRPYSSQHIGILIHSQPSPFAQRLLAELHCCAREEQFTLRTRWVSAFDEQAVEEASSLAAEGCGALVLPWFPADLTESVVQFIGEAPRPVVLSRYIKGLEANCFEQPSFYGVGLTRITEALCVYLGSLGYGSLALLGPRDASDDIVQRSLAAYSCYVSQHGKSPLIGLVGSSSDDMDELAGQWERQGHGLGIISYDDTHALRFMTAMHKRGLTAGRDYGIVGENDIDAALFSDPPLSTVAHAYPYMARALLESARALAEGRLNQSSEIAPRTLLVRGSCGGAGRITPQVVKTVEGLGLLIENTVEAQMATAPVRREEADAELAYAGAK